MTISRLNQPLVLGQDLGLALAQVLVKMKDLCQDQETQKRF